MTTFKAELEKLNEIYKKEENVTERKKSDLYIVPPEFMPENTGEEGEPEFLF